MALVDNAWYVNYGDGSAGAGKKSYFDVTTWVTATVTVCGALIRATAPAVGSERVRVCVASTAGTGATGVSEPTWTTTRGAINTDGTVSWQEATGIAALNGDLTNTPTWTTIKNTAVTLGQVIKNVAGNLILICTTAGTAGNGAEPTWAAFTNAGATTADNTVTWTTLGASFAAWSAPHARGAAALTTNWAQAGNTVFVGDNHAETRTTSLTWTGAGTIAAPINIFCVDRSVATPPTGSDTKTTATVNSTGGASFTFNGIYYVYGITFNCGSGAVANGINMSGTFKIFENCALRKLGTTAGTAVAFSGTTRLINTTFQIGASGDVIACGGLFIWENTLSAITGATFPTSLFNFSNGIGLSGIIKGVDFSPLPNGTIINGATSVSSSDRMNFINCKLPSSAVFNAPNTPMFTIDNIVSDSAATNYRNERYTYTGIQTTETTIVRTGGASDGTTPISWKFVNTANSKWILPFESQPISIWNDSTSAITTLTFYGTTTGGGVPNNDDIWVEVEYLGDASSPQGSFKTTTKSNNLAASVTTNNSSDGSTWGDGGAGNGFKIVVPSFTPAQKGPLNITIKVAKASATYYIDPRPSINNVPVSKSFILSPGVYVNELGPGDRFSGGLFI